MTRTALQKRKHARRKADFITGERRRQHGRNVLRRLEHRQRARRLLDSMQCSNLTGTGVRCKRKVMGKGLRYCVMHNHKNRAVPMDDSVISPTASPPEAS